MTSSSDGSRVSADRLDWSVAMSSAPGSHGETPHTEFAGEMSYGDYLHLDPLVDAQQPRSGNHNEMLFIIQHQTSERCSKLALHESRATQARGQADDHDPGV